MNSLSRQYLFGSMFIAFGLYQVYKNELLEFALYGFAGISFIFNALALEPKLTKYKKPLGIITWVFIGVTGIFFLYMLRSKTF